MAAPGYQVSRMKHPDNMKRKDKLAHIQYLKRSGQEVEAWVFYMRHCAGISQRVFEETK